MTSQVAPHSALPRTAALLVLCAALVTVALAAPDDNSVLWRILLGVLAGVLLVAGAGMLVLEARRRRQLRRRAASADASMPGWALTLPDDWYADLESRLSDLHLRAQRAEQGAQESRRRAAQSMGGMWQVVSSAVNSEERARGRFVADLHDSVVQTVIVCTYLAESEDTPRSELAEQLRGAEQQLRDLMVSTRPADLRRGNLSTAAASLARSSQRRHNLEVEWSWPAHDAELPESIAHTIYRFWQEGLGNVAKHAGVNRARVGLRLGTEILAWVEDDGAGFDPAEAEDTYPTTGYHVGLGLMRDRAQQIGARVEVRSAAGQGTRVELSLPYPPTLDERPVAVGEGPAVPAYR